MDVLDMAGAGRVRPTTRAVRLLSRPSAKGTFRRGSVAPHGLVLPAGVQLLRGVEVVQTRLPLALRALVSRLVPKRPRSLQVLWPWLTGSDAHNARHQSHCACRENGCGREGEPTRADHSARRPRELDDVSAVTSAARNRPALARMPHGFELIDQRHAFRALGGDVEAGLGQLLLRLRDAHARGALDFVLARLVDELPPDFYGAALGHYGSSSKGTPRASASRRCTARLRRLAAA